MFKQKLLPAIILGTLMSTTTFAANVSINGTIPGVVHLKQNSVNKDINASSEKEISFERIILSAEAKKHLAELATKQQKQPNSTVKKSSLPNESFLGMNGVPVLDQGRHGTCVTFAVTGAIDATINANKENGSFDRYSQLCSLELGSTLERKSIVHGHPGEDIYPSGWNGSWGTIVLNQIQTYGLISKSYQESEGCAGVYEYPLSSQFDTGKAMMVPAYKKNSESIFAPISYQVLMSPEDAFTSKVDPDVILEKVKTAISNKHRVTFGVLLDVDQGYNGALGTYKAYHDTWLLTDEIAADAKAGTIQAGHEMIIIGYDDNAEVLDPNNIAHKGVLTLRNSWSSSAGDQGNYYMTYDHFKTLAMEAAEIIPASH